LSLAKTRARKALPAQAGLDVRAALRAICSTGKGHCWFCDRRLPRVEEAVGTGWAVLRVEGQRVASIILVCPKCQVRNSKLETRNSVFGVGVSNCEFRVSESSST
jgi:hypothetical protein